MAAPRPVYHSLSVLRHKDPGDGAAGLGSTIACCPQPCGVPRTAVLKPGSAAAVPSLRGLEDAKRVEWAGVWVDLALGVAEDSAVLRALPGRGRDQLLFLFSDRSAGTLRKHLPGWRLWLSFCQGVQVAPAKADLAAILDFLDVLATGAKLDRGKGCCGKA